MAWRKKMRGKTDRDKDRTAPNPRWRKAMTDQREEMQRHFPNVGQINKWTD